MLPDETPQERIARFAKALTERFTSRYPTTAFAGGLSKAGDSSFAATKDELVRVPGRATRPFAFKRTNIDQFIAANRHRTFPSMRWPISRQRSGCSVSRRTTPRSTP